MADLNLADRNFQRIRELYDNGIAPRKEHEQAEDNLTRVRSEAERARLKLANLGARPGRMDNRFALHAPISGTVTERNINPGMEVRPDLPAPLIRHFRSEPVMGADGYFREGYRPDSCRHKNCC